MSFVPSKPGMRIWADIVVGRDVATTSVPRFR
jgi:hypothetical protein